MEQIWNSILPDWKHVGYIAAVLVITLVLLWIMIKTGVFGNKKPKQDKPPQPPQPKKRCVSRILVVKNNLTDHESRIVSDTDFGMTWKYANPATYAVPTLIIYQFTSAKEIKDIESLIKKCVLVNHSIIEDISAICEISDGNTDRNTDEKPNKENDKITE